MKCNKKIKNSKTIENFTILTSNCNIYNAVNIFDNEIIVPKEYKHKRWTYHELAKIAKSKGFKINRYNGDHHIFRHKLSNLIVVIPYKANKTLALKTSQRILCQIFSKSYNLSF